MKFIVRRLGIFERNVTHSFLSLISRDQSHSLCQKVKKLMTKRFNQWKTIKPFIVLSWHGLVSVNIYRTRRDVYGPKINSVIVHYET